LYVFLIYVILPVVLYGYDTWSPTLKEENRLRIFENEVQKRKFGLETQEITEQCRKFHYEQLSVFPQLRFL